jgi:Tfp pilus assembly protein PilN
MIRINLANKRKIGASKFDLKNITLQSILDLLKGDGERKKFDINSPISKLILMAIVIYFVDDTLSGYRQINLKEMDQQLSVVQKEGNEIQEKLSKIRGFEPIKKQLEDDERTVRTKLDVLTQLVQNRNMPAKLLMQIAQVIPQEVWLTNITVGADRVQLSGGTPGHNQVSDFIKALSGTAYFSDVTLKGIHENTTVAKDQKFQSFDLEARKR